MEENLPERQTLPPDQRIDPQVGNILAAWEYPEYIQYARGWMWYMIAGLITALLLVYSYFSDNRLFMIIIVLVAVVFVIANSRRPETISFAITEGGIIIKDKFISYSDITNFWIIYQPPSVKTLYIEPSSIFSPRIQIHLENQSPSAIRELLLQYLTEDLKKEEEPSSESWGRLLKL